MILSFMKRLRKIFQNLIIVLKNFLLKKLTQIINNPEIGKDLGNKNNLILAGLKKVYFDNKRYRIVYEIKDKEILIHIIAIGKRDDMKVYKEAHSRYEERNKF